MAELTKRELHRRIASARGQAAAMLFFRLLPPPPPKNGKRRETISALRYQNDEAIRGLVTILEALFDGNCPSPEGDCGACGKPIRGGQSIVSTEDAGNFHATKRCWGSVSKSHLHRAETQREQDRDARKQMQRAKDYLKARGRVA